MTLIHLDAKATLAGLIATALLLEPLQFRVMPAGALEGAYALLACGILLAGCLGQRFTRLELLSLGVILVVMARGAATGDPLIAALGTVWLLKPIFAFLAGALLAGPRTSWIVRRVALMGALIISGTIFAEAAGVGWMNSAPGHSGAYLGPAQAAHAGVLALLLLQTQRRRRGTFRVWGTLLLFAGVAMTGSRHGLVLGLLALVPVRSVAGVAQARWGRHVAAVLLIAAVVIGTVGQSTLQRVDEVGRILEGRDYYRLHAAIVSLNAGRVNLGTGVGPGQFGGPVANRFASDGEYQRELFGFWTARGAADRPVTTDLAAAHIMGELGYAGFLVLYGWGVLLALNRPKGGSHVLFSWPRALVVVGAASLFTFAPLTNGPLQLLFFLMGASRPRAARRWLPASPLETSPPPPPTTRPAPPPARAR